MARFRPKISLYGSGEVVELSNGSHADFTLMQGASGLGMRPREITTVALPSGGSLVQHRKGLEADVQIPVLLGGSERKRWDLRRKLERLVRDEVEIRVTRPNGVYRSRFGFYKAGLEGEYGAGEDSPNGEKRVLEFTCPEGMWKGEEQDPEFRLAGIRKRFLSDRAEPVPTGRRNVAVNPSFEYGVSGWRAVRSNLSDRAHSGALDGLNASGGRELLLTSTSTTASAFADSDDIDVVPGQWVAVAALGASDDGIYRAGISFYRNAGASGWVSEGWSSAGYSPGRKVYSAQVPSGASCAKTGLRVQSADNGHPLNGESAVFDDVIASVADSEAEALAAVAEYKDGDSPFWGWAGEPGDSESIEYEKSSTYQSPFFPMILASSTVQGEIDVNIGGDAPVYPTWVIDGPGSDLIIENDKGDSLKVLTEFEDQVTITTDQLRQDITSPSMPDGELWEYVPTGSKFFALEPGMNKLRVSMVGAKPNSLVKCLYRENFWAGW